VIRSPHWSAGKAGCIVEENSARDVAILEQRIGGTSSIAIAERYGCTITEVDAALDRRLNYDLDNPMRLRMIKLDCARIEALMAPFFERAVNGDCDAIAVAAATLVCKLLERRALLLGLDQPTQSRVDVFTIPSPNTPSGYQKITDVLMQLKHSRSNGGDGAALDDPDPDQS